MLVSRQAKCALVTLKGTMTFLMGSLTLRGLDNNGYDLDLRIPEMAEVKHIGKNDDQLFFEVVI